MAVKRPGASTIRRRALRFAHFASDRAWTGANERGWFKAPRTLPLILALMGSKKLSGSQDPSRVYLDLLARHVDEGIVQMGNDEDHAYSSGYEGPRGVRTWRERMRILERTGFIKVKSIGSRYYGYVLLVHPAAVVERLRREQPELVPDVWWEAYCDRQAETGEVPAVDPAPEPAEATGTPAVADTSDARDPFGSGVRMITLDE